MPANVIMPALEMAQDTGRLIRWLKREGETVRKGEPLMEIETDKVTTEIEATSTGILRGVSAKDGDVIPVGRVIAQIVAPGEELWSSAGDDSATKAPEAVPGSTAIKASVLARKIATEHNLDLSLVKPNGGRIEKADVLAYLAQSPAIFESVPGIVPASPKARRLAKQQGVDLATVTGSGPQGAVLAADMSAMPPAPHAESNTATSVAPADVGVSNVWRIMTERIRASWTTAPHFYLVRHVKAVGLVEMRTQIAPAIEKRTSLKPTYTDILVRLVASVLRDHPRLNARWADGGIRLNSDINVGVATAIDEGLVVPVIHKADALSIGEIASQREDLVTRAGESKLRPADIADGTFTLSNLGMYGVDAFSAIVNPPQAAILAVGRIADQVVPENGEPVVRPMLTLTLSCDHRVVDGARAAIFLNDLASLIEMPWQLLA
ncbi:MAG: 2-oxo acid dehydrogenase subunit E2 [Chloroflexota bacterium]|nr:2-oxo acid dehydrogenase subunit E2 [Chloroflexota bacterium]